MSRRGITITDILVTITLTFITLISFLSLIDFSFTNLKKKKKAVPPTCYLLSSPTPKDMAEGMGRLELSQPHPVSSLLPQ